MDRRLNHVTTGFTLIELLVVVLIISLLLTILLPALSSVRNRMKGLKCATNLRTVAFRFHLFAEGDAPIGRGDSDRRGRKSFFIGDFQETLYGIDEFWDLGGATTGVLESRQQIMLCPSGARTLTKRRDYPCSNAALGPAEDVSLAVNMRLYRAVVKFMGKDVLAPAASTHVRPDVLSHPYAPLVMDVDGRTAVARGLEPFYTAPPRPGATDPYANGHYWMPSARHGRVTCVGFVGGHVLTSPRPERERWDWGYQAEVGG